MLGNDIAIKVSELNKIYRIGVQDEAQDNIAGVLVNFIKNPVNNYRKFRSLYNFDDVLSSGPESAAERDDILWAIKNVSFELKQGEVLGLIGGNGAGKSTLLKMLARITSPTSGRAEIRGRISSLLEVGTGFHPELTGRENVFLNGTILGMKQKEVKRKFDDIVGFSGIGRFIDTPVKRYSSGMRVRLAFSVAAFMEPEILLVDEVLAVGDVTFQKQCLGKMSEVSRQGRTIVFVSHNMAAIERLCNRVILLERGEIRRDTDPKNAIMEYYESTSEHTDAMTLDNVPRKDGFVPVLQRVEFFNPRGNAVTTVQSGDALTVRIHYKHKEPLKDPHFGMVFETYMGEKVFWVQTKMQKGPLPEMASSGVVECTIPRLPLVAGSYYVTVGCGAQAKQLDNVNRGLQLQVSEADVFGTGIKPDPKNGLIFVDADWEVLEG